MAKRRKIPESEGALPKEQQWTVDFLNEKVTAEYSALAADLKAAFWELHDKIRFYGLPTLTIKEAKRLAGTKDLWELRFRSKTGHGRGVYVQRTGRRIVVLVFLTKKMGKLAKQILDLAAERRKTLEEVLVEALKDDRMAARLVNARDVFERDYPEGTPKRAKIDAQIQVALAKHARKVKRAKIIKALPRKAKEKLVKVLRARVAGQSQAAG